MPVAKLNIMSILEEIRKDEARSIIITLPSHIEWSDYEKELAAVADGRKVLNFKVSHFPKGVQIGDRCYLVYRGYVVGWQKIAGFTQKDFTCTTTHKKWSGNFIERSGPFHYLDERIPMKGFQGFRYFSLNQYNQEQKQNQQQ